MGLRSFTEVPYYVCQAAVGHVLARGHVFCAQRFDHFGEGDPELALLIGRQAAIDMLND